MKVPQMAESISEGTLSTFSKQVGDHVEQDEEIASIETDKIDVSVNAPSAGVITELLVSEGDTVTVGQDLAKIDAGASGGGSETAGTEAKSPASDAQETSSQPEGQTESESSKQDKPAPEPKQEEKKPEKKPEPKSEPKPEPKKESKPEPKKESTRESKPDDAKPTKKDSGTSTDASPSPFGKGSRAEHRVSIVELNR